VSTDDVSFTWARVLDAGLTHVERLSGADLDYAEWLVRSPAGLALVRIRFERSVHAWCVETYARATHHSGASGAAAEWVLEDVRSYVREEVSQMLDDVAAIVG
jgi:hypothetical protein